MTEEMGMILANLNNGIIDKCSGAEVVAYIQKLQAEVQSARAREDDWNEPTLKVDSWGYKRTGIAGELLVDIYRILKRNKDWGKCYSILDDALRAAYAQGARESKTK